MIEGLTFEYAHARVAARLGQRPDERLWTQLRALRSVPALLEAMRASSAASTVSGIALGSDADTIELAFRQQLRNRIIEVAGWAPPAWQPALLYTRHLVDLPAIVHLLGSEPPPRWIGADPVLASYASPSSAERRRALIDGPLGPLASAIDEEMASRRSAEPLARALRRLRAGGGPHYAIAAWEAEWRLRWPPVATETRERIDAVARLLGAQLERFPSLTVEDAPGARQALGARLASVVRRNANEPAALFAYLALFAIDLERLRGEFLLRARPVAGFA